MISIDRTKMPEIRQIEKIDFRQPDVFNLPNGINIYSFHSANQPLIRMEFLFKAGSKFNSNFRIASVVNKMILEGVKSKTGDQISEIIDTCGAHIKTEVTSEVASVTVSVLHKHILPILDLLAEIFEYATFPQKELDLILGTKTQELLINNQKVSFVARNQFPSILFGENHLYGHPALIEDYQSITTDLLKEFYSTYYQGVSFDIILSGSINSEIISHFDRIFGQASKREINDISIKPYSTSTNKYQTIEISDSVQNAVRIGRIWPNRKSEDYAGIQLLLNLYGGYFGSRLMTNIREDKGYTYGIGAGVRHFKNTSYMFISSEVKAENYKDVVFEIFAEMEKLKTEKVSIEELNTVRSVMMGSFQRGFDGPFAQADRFKELLINDLDRNFYIDFVENLKEVQSKDLMRLAQLYLNSDDYYTLIVGKL